MNQEELMKEIGSFGKKLKGKNAVGYARKKEHWFRVCPSFLVDFEARMQRCGVKTEEKVMKIMFRLCQTPSMWEDKRLIVDYIDNYTAKIFAPEFDEMVEKEKKEKKKRQDAKAEKEEKRNMRRERLKEKMKTVVNESSETKKKIVSGNPVGSATRALPHRRH